MNGTAKSKREAALKSGYSLNVANSVKNLENTRGVKNAMISVSDQLGLTTTKLIMELEKRDIGELPTQDIIKSIVQLSQAYKNFMPKDDEDSANKANLLKAILTDAPKIQEAQMVASTKEEIKSAIDL
jgi:hypothetical protein